jgi:hypothetical protein
MQTFNCLATTQNESDKTQITFRKEKDHNGMVRTNHCEPNKYELVGCVVTGNGVVEQGPGDGSWVCESYLLL